MKKLFVLCASVIMITACTGRKTPTKVEYENYDCHCKICEVCDSFAKYKWGTPEHTKWYDSLTVVVYDYLYNDGEYWSCDPTEDLLHCPKFMHAMDNGFDGLCGDCYDTHSEAIDEFYNVVNK